MLIKRLSPFKIPTSWQFTDPDTGHYYRATTKEGLLKQIISYREQNRLEPITSLSDVVENYLCSLPENCSVCEEIKLHRSWRTYLKGGITLLENLFYGEKNMVSQDVANKRAMQCIDCPYNVNPEKGAFESWADGIALACTNGRTTPHDISLFNCEVCSCVIKAKVHFKGPFKITKEEEEKFKTVACWQLKKENYW